MCRPSVSLSVTLCIMYNGLGIQWCGRSTTSCPCWIRSSTGGARDGRCRAGSAASRCSVPAGHRTDARYRRPASSGRRIPSHGNWLRLLYRYSTILRSDNFRLKLGSSNEQRRTVDSRVRRSRPGRPRERSRVDEDQWTCP